MTVNLIFAITKITAISIFYLKICKFYQIGNLILSLTFIKVLDESNCKKIPS